MDGPDQIGPDHKPKRTISDKVRYAVKTFTTRYGFKCCVMEGTLTNNQQRGPTRRLRLWIPLYPATTFHKTSSQICPVLRSR